MDNSTPFDQDEQFIASLQDSAKALVEKLQSDSFEEASSLIEGLVDARNSHIFNAVGQLTRGLHEAIVNFNVDSENGQPEENEPEIRDASSRLNYVISMTQDAADKTMDKVEAIAPVAANLGDEAKKLKEEWIRLKRREISVEEFKALYNRIDVFLDQMEDGTQKLSGSLQDIILEQGYQDLTGQVLRRVIGLVTEVERDLINLMRIAGQVEEVAGLAQTGTSLEDNKADIVAEGPQIDAEKRQDVVANQDDVDDLLSSLGF